MKLDWLFFLW